jgi:Tfp pilus assembly protein PilN
METMKAQLSDTFIHFLNAELLNADQAKEITKLKEEKAQQAQEIAKLKEAKAEQATVNVEQAKKIADLEKQIANVVCCGDDCVDQIDINEKDEEYFCFECASNSVKVCPV